MLYQQDGLAFLGAVQEKYDSTKFQILLVKVDKKKS